MSRPRRTVEDWRRSVFGAAVSDRTKVLLLLMADHMRANRHVSVPRKTLADKLGKTERRVTERITEAHEAGLLYTVERGRVGRTAVYEGTFPDVERGRTSRPLEVPESGTSTSPLSSAETRPLSERERGRTGRPPITTADLSLGPHDRDASSNEDGCRFHGWASCPDDCADHPDTRRRSA